MNLLPPLLILCLLLAPNLALAAAPWCTGSGRTTNWTPPTSFTLQRDALDGTVLHSTGWMDNGAATANCTGDSPLMILRGYSPSVKSTQFSNVYETGVPGIGIKVGSHNTYSSTPSSIDSSTLMKSPMDSWPGMPTNFTPAQRFWVQLIKIGPMQSGTFSVPKVQIFYENLLTNTLTFNTTTINVVNRGCFVDASLLVKLPEVNRKAFSGVGSTVGAKAFDIPLECDSNTKVSYRIDGTSAASNVLATTTGADQATGVGIQLFKGDTSSTTVQPLASKTLYATTPAHLIASLRIPLTARYYQTADEVTAGAVSANATITLFYE